MLFISIEFLFKIIRVHYVWYDSRNQFVKVDQLVRLVGKLVRKWLPFAYFRMEYKFWTILIKLLGLQV